MCALEAGACQVEITPQADIHLAGAVGSYRPAKLVLDPLYARALVLRRGERKLCFLSLDLTIITQEWTEKIRQWAAQECGLEPDAVMVHVTQTHSAPSLGHFMVDPDLETDTHGHEWVRGGDPRYFPFAFERITQAIRGACDKLARAHVAAGSGIEGRFACNRRAVMRDGRVAMPGRQWPGPTGPVQIRYLEGPVDPEVGVVCVRSQSLKVLALLLHHSCHPVHVFPKPVVSADWPGAWAEAMRRAYGDQCVPLVLNGACGNINPWPAFEPHFDNDHRRMGRFLGDMTQKVMEMLEFQSDAVLDWRVRRLGIPIREVEPARLREAEALLRQHPDPMWAATEPRHLDSRWTKAASLVSVQLCRQRKPELDYEIQVLRVGPTGFVGLPGEPFVEGQLQIKVNSPTYPTYVAHCTSQYVGYVPTRAAFPRGGHEVETSYWSKLVPDALDRIVDASLELLRGVFPRDSQP